MIKICKVPRILQHEDRWGQLEPGFYVDDYYGYVDEMMWKQLKMFESFDMKQKVSDETELMIAALLTYSHGYSLWQFNMRTENTEGDGQYIRSFAVLGGNTLKQRTVLDDIYAFYLKIKCRWMNRNIK